jgi:hypothetical protein
LSFCVANEKKSACKIALQEVKSQSIKAHRSQSAVLFINTSQTKIRFRQNPKMPPERPFSSFANPKMLSERPDREF